MSNWVPDYLKQMLGYFSNPNIYMYGRWDNPPSANEGGVDLGSPGGTPVFALASGPIVGLGNFTHPNGQPGYGVVTTRVNIPGYGMNDLYYQHIQIQPGLKVGDTVQRGQRIGTIIPGVNMLEMGLNANWGGIWGSNHPSAWATDPRPQIQSLMAMGDPSTTSPVSLTTPGTSAVPPDIISSILSGIGLPTPAAVTTFFDQFMLIFFGGLLVLLGIMVLFFGSDTGKKVVKTGVEAAAA